MWNSAVDEYIASGVDDRPVWEIEAGAKLGVNGGPLYKWCEEKGCGKREGKDVDKVKCCGSCKLVSGF